MDYKCITTIQEITKYIGDSKIVAFDIETSPIEKYRNEQLAALDPHKAVIVGISLSVLKGTAVYIPLNHRVGINAKNPKKIMDWLTQSIFKNGKVIKIAHNLSFEAMFLYSLGIVLQKPCYDTIAASQMTLKSNTEFRNLSDSGLKTLVTELYDIEMPKFEEVTAGRHFDELDPQDYETVRYACADSDYTLQLYNLFNDWFDKYLPKHRWIIENIESPTAVYVGIMKYNGVTVDKALMYQIQFDVEEKILNLRMQIKEIIGDINIGENAVTTEFKEYLHKTLNLPVLKTTAKYQVAADEEAFDLLKEWCIKNNPSLIKLFDLILEFRKWGKIKSTYIDGYLKCINNKTERLHPNFFQLGAESGRLSCRNPNIQNCFDNKTEILTKRGFILFANLIENDEVAQWENGDISFVKPLEIITQKYVGKMIHIKNQHIDLCMTPEHRCMLKNRKTNKIQVVEAKNYLKDAKQIQAGQFIFGNKSLNLQQVIFICATQADGYVKGSHISFKFSKERKYYRLKYALDVMRVPYNETITAAGQFQISVLKSKFSEWVINLLGQKKTWGEWLLSYDRKTIKLILAEIQNWDGCYTRENFYSSSIKENADWIQILYVLTGTRAHLREYWNGNPNSVINYQIDITDRDFSQTANVIKTEVDYCGLVYCVEVPSSYIVVRRGNQVSITGNCPSLSNDLNIRDFIVAPDKHSLIELDYSQIEARLTAFLSRDEKLLSVFQKKQDLHAMTTSAVFGISLEEAKDKSGFDYKHRRTVAKTTFFGFLYGIYAKSLMRNLKLSANIESTKEQCSAFLSNLSFTYDTLSNWQNETISRAKFNGYAETVLGRRRYLPQIYSTDFIKRGNAERAALNHGVQGLAADILKLSMARLILILPEYLKPIFTVHDSLIFECPDDMVYDSVLFIKQAMETPPPIYGFDIDIVAEVSVGKSYGNMKELINA